MSQPTAAPSTPAMPYNQDAESACISAVLINPTRAYFECARIVKAGDFYVIRHRWLWETFETLVQKQIPIEPITICHELESKPSASPERFKSILDEMGGAAYITGLVSAATTSLNAATYAQMVKDESNRRCGVAIANQIANDALDNQSEFSLGTWALKLAEASGGNGKKTTPSQAANQVTSILTNEPCFYTTGLPDVDSRISGLFPQELDILAGYQGSGKSAVLIQMARKNAEQGRLVDFFSLEMTAAQVWLRMACGDLGVDVNQVRAHKTDEATRLQVIRKSAELAEMYEGKILMYGPPMTPADVLSVCMMDRPDLALLDHLKNVDGRERNENDLTFFGRVVRFFRQNVALSCNLCFVLAHQLSRSSQKENRDPNMHDLYMAGEDSPDGVFLLKRDETNNGMLDGKAWVDYIIAKSRFGWTGSIPTIFDLPHQQFYGRMSGPEPIRETAIEQEEPAPREPEPEYIQEDWTEK